jgi:hypothetical protein
VPAYLSNHPLILDRIRFWSLSSLWFTSLPLDLINGFVSSFIKSENMGSEGENVFQRKCCACWYYFCWWQSINRHSRNYSFLTKFPWFLVIFIVVSLHNDRHDHFIPVVFIYQRGIFDLRHRMQTTVRRWHTFILCFRPHSVTSLTTLASESMVHQYCSSFLSDPSDDGTERRARTIVDRTNIYQFWSETTFICSAEDIDPIELWAIRDHCFLLLHCRTKKKGDCFRLKSSIRRSSLERKR